MTTTTTRVDIMEVQTRQARLEQARAALHAHFVGIDTVIDELIDAVAVWYLMPEVLARPVVVNLGGMTGVGKTDLVRRLVRSLDLQHRFVEIELSHTDAESRHELVADRLGEAGLLDSRPGILLADEIQRFRTLTPNGDPIPQTRFGDFWELLSDGWLSRRDSPDLDWLIASMREDRDAIIRRRTKGKRSTEPDEIGLWHGRSLQRTLGLPAPLDALAGLSHGEALRRLEQARADKRLHQPVDCRQLLVIVSGNLDEAFPMARDTDEADVDADIVAAYTAKVSVVDVKAALRRRFTPEQVARFGNVHLVYRSLRRIDFERVIAREIARLAEQARQRLGIAVQVGPAVSGLVYRNGVFPVQGVRPALSSVGDIVGTHLAKLLCLAALAGVDEVHLDYDEAAGELVGTVGARGAVVPEQQRWPFAGRADRVRDAARADQLACVAVHEAGHALAYAALFGLAPLQLTARAAGTDADGFTYRHHAMLTRDSMADLAVVALAGGLAEELVFGVGNASAGRATDRARATELVLDAVRRYGFDRWHADRALEHEHAMNTSVTDETVEQVLAGLVDRARLVLVEHRSALLALATRLALSGNLSSVEVVALLGEHGVCCEARAEGHEWTPPYAALLALAR
ncbi:MAG TPA: hypothetical protein P5181_04500 [Dermatophilaceae bacterium]|nr:hypothetical protein [Dermatophilaceae bacterium]